MKRSKAYTAAAAKIDADKLYAPLDAVRLAKETSSVAKFDATVEVAIPAGGRPPQGRPDGPWHRQPAARYGQNRPGRRVRNR